MAKRSLRADERLAWLRLSRSEQVGPATFRRLIAAFGTAQTVIEALPELSRRSRGRPIELHSADAAEQEVDRLTTMGGRLIAKGEPDYPDPLAAIEDAPPVISVLGRIDLLPRPLVAVVGARNASANGRFLAETLARQLGELGWVVVSGLARGIDREAHEGCVAAEGRSVAVLGNGIDMIYPASSRGAAAALLDFGGAIVSEYPPGVPPLRWHFPARNRIISGLCRGVVVVQAPEKSGALFTAEYAADQNRDLWVHAAGTVGSTGAGTRRLAESGAPAIHGAKAIFRDWGIIPPPTRPHDPPAGISEGRRLAAVVKEEIDGTCARRAGEAYWRT